MLKNHIISSILDTEIFNFETSVYYAYPLFL